MANSFLRRATRLFFVILNIVTAFLFIISCYGWWFDPIHFWYIGLLTIGSLYFFLALVIFIFFWVFVKPKFIFISILAILFCISPLQNLFGFRLGKKFVLEKAASTIRVMSWNVEHFEILQHKEHPEIKEEMLRTIALYNPDIACFQEMVGSDTFPKAINYLPAIKGRLKMPYSHYSYNPILDFDSKHHFGIIILSKFPIISIHTLSYAPNDYNSIFQYADILKDQDTFRVFNIHLQSLKFDKENIKYLQQPAVAEGENLTKSKGILSKFKKGFVKRKTQSDRIHEAVEKSPYPVILCGDFNDVPNSYAYHTIGGKMQNAFREKGGGISRTFSGISPTLRIDNIFASRHFSFLQYSRVKKKMSDHFPLVVDLQIK